MRVLPPRSFDLSTIVDLDLNLSLTSQILSTASAKVLELWR